MTGRLDKFRPLGFALLGVFGVMSFIYELDHRFFFMDDRQIQYFPYGLVIRDALLHGNFPWVTIRTFFGGALWLDPQYGLYNPLSLAMDFLINREDLLFSAFLISLILNLLLTASAYTLGRAYGLQRNFAALLGLMAGINIYVLYFLSDTWQPGLISLVWFLLAWAGLKKLAETRGNVALRVLGASALIFLTVSSGWPHQYVALAAVMAVLFADTWRQDRKRALRLVWAGALGAIFSLPVLAPVATAAGYWTRAGGLFNNGVFTPDLGDILNFSNPAWLPHYRNAFMRVSPVPLFFAGWFVLPLLMMANLRRAARKLWKEQGGLLAILGVFILLVFSAQNMGPLRWPMRWLVDAQLASLATVLLLAQTTTLRADALRIKVALGALGVTTLAAIVESPPETAAVLWLVVLPALFIGALPFIKDRLAGFLGATSVVMVMAMALCFHSSSLFIDHGKRADSPGAAVADDGSQGYTFYWGIKEGFDDLSDERDFLLGGMGGYYNINTTNGYSSYSYKGLDEVFPGFHDFSYFAGTEKPHLAAREPETGAAFVDLLKISKIVTEKKAAPEGLGNGWHQSAETTPLTFEKHVTGGMAFDKDRLVTLRRRDANKLPGTVSWWSPGMAVGGAARPEANGETIDIKNGAQAGLVVFARLYYPGFRATLDHAPLRVRPLDGMLVAVEIPPDAAGALTLSFVPPFFGACLTLVALALAGWAAFFVAETKGRF